MKGQTKVVYGVGYVRWALLETWSRGHYNPNSILLIKIHETKVVG